MNANRRIVRYSKVNPFASFRDELENQWRYNSESTIESKFKCGECRRHIKARLNFAKTYLSFGMMGQKQCYLVEQVHQYHPIHTQDCEERWT